jgi:hypothetical protein
MSTFQMQMAKTNICERAYKNAPDMFRDFNLVSAVSAVER